MSVTELYLANNRAYASRHTGPLPMEPSQRVAVVACMDARQDIYAVLGLEEGEASVIRNAGGVITEDVIRSLAVSQQLLGTDEIMLIHHTDCRMLTYPGYRLKEPILSESGMRPLWPEDSFHDVEVDVRWSISRVKASPYLPHRESVRGFVLDIATGLLEEVT
ncbi:carbonic anhydrase [Streptomyces spororaveus]|uniref:carbonic anhydrase n=1 Tax=Streptomyces spororaveus TaxID=284039 RepID=A0ABQ3T6N6_9ACTN|nr:carbonic anhydrase [Streptomyces spororaveus]GHI76062.1 carbonic anhydrase [Streptomyces spororaveus]